MLHPETALLPRPGRLRSRRGTDAPHRRDLDALDSRRPELIRDITMHSLWVNSRWLEVTGLSVDVVAPLPRVAYLKRDAAGQLCEPNRLFTERPLRLIGGEALPEIGQNVSGFIQPSNTPLAVINPQAGHFQVAATGQ